MKKTLGDLTRMKNVLIGFAVPFLVVGCISTDLGSGPSAKAPDSGVNAERGTGSNLSRKERDTRQNVDREELERMQRSGSGNATGRGS